MDKKIKTATLLLRIGLAFSFFYAAVSSFLEPQSWLGFFPEWLFNISPLNQEITLTIFSAGEIVLGLWLLSGWRLFEASLVSAALLVAIVLFNLGAMIIVFRDVSLVMAALSLAVLAKMQ